MRPIKTYAEPRFAVLYCGVLGLVIPLWVITTYAAEDDRRAILISLLIMGGFPFGIYWLWYYAAEFAAQERELGKLDAAQSAIDRTPRSTSSARGSPARSWNGCTAAGLPRTACS